MPRVIVLMLDSFGIGASLDAKQYHDQGADTFGHVVEAYLASSSLNSKNSLHIPNLTKLGLCRAHLASTGKRIASLDYQEEPIGSYGYAVEISLGKDTPSGHWEIMGVPVHKPFGYFPPQYPSFPKDLIDALCEKSQLPGVLGNCHASGTAIIQLHGEESIKTGKPIVYTSADSVFQIAAHEAHFGLERLYQLCEMARILVDSYSIGRVIARPFIGKDGKFVRTSNRRDYAMPPPQLTLLDIAKNNNCETVAIGKVADIFAHQGITKTIRAKGNMHLFDETLHALNHLSSPSIVFTNFTDFDTEFGHRRDALGYAQALEAFDKRLPELYAMLKDDDIIILTADHGCDPTYRGTDHTREHIPVLVYGNKINPRFLGRRETFADIGQTIAEYLSLPALDYGVSFLADKTLGKVI